MKKPKYDAFISYSRKDKLEVKQFLARIKSAIPTIEYWIDTANIHSGDDYEDKIMNAIEKSALAICCVSNNSIKSKYVRTEVNYAINTNKRVVPLLLKNSQLKKWMLYKMDHLDRINSTIDGDVDRLIQELSHLTGKEIATIESSNIKEVSDVQNNTNVSQRNTKQETSTEDNRKKDTTKKRSQNKTYEFKSYVTSASSHIIDTVVGGSRLASTRKPASVAGDSLLNSYPNYEKLLGIKKKKSGITITNDPITGKLKVIGNPTTIQENILKHKRIHNT